jgi:RecB family exonuclease
MSFFSDLFKPKTPPTKGVKPKKVPTTGKCPYCEAELTPRPGQKKKCSHCSQLIIVRTHFKTKEKILLTEVQAAQFDIEKEKYYAVTSFLRGLGNSGIDRKTIDKLVLQQTEVLAEKFGKEPSFADVAWGVSNKLIIKYPDLSQGIHFQQALFLHREGRDPTKIRLIDHKKTLKEYQKSEVVTGVEVCTAGEQSCEHCRKLENKVFTIEEALKDNTLPCKECTFDANEGGFGWCRCCYTPRV